MHLELFYGNFMLVTAIVPIESVYKQPSAFYFFIPEYVDFCVESVNIRILRF